MTRLLELLDDYRPVIEAAQRARDAGDLGELARFQGSTLITCTRADCHRAAVVTGERDVEALAELIAYHGWTVRGGKLLCSQDA